jgi:hypothetical protein
MTVPQIIGLITFIVAVAGVLGFLFQTGKTTHYQEPATKPYTEEELDNIKLAEELYNKDLRPVVVQKTKPKASTKELEVVEPEFVAKESKPEFPIDAPKKKRKYYPKKKK